MTVRVKIVFKLSRKMTMSEVSNLHDVLMSKYQFAHIHDIDWQQNRISDKLGDEQQTIAGDGVNANSEN